MNPQKKEAYLELLKSLNTNQREAVDQIYGPVLVLAGPGTGKTHMLTTRIAHILNETDASAQNILCLTFTENAAVEMRHRLQRLIGADSYKIKIATFHGFSQSVIDNNPAIFESKIQGKILADDLQKALVFREVLQSQPWEYFRPIYDEFAEQRTFSMAADKLKREHITPEALQESIPEERDRLESNPKNFYTRKYGAFEKGDFKPNEKAKIERKLGKLTEFCLFWKRYEQAMENQGFYDFNDLINWTVEAMQTNEELRFDLQEQFQWILVDEYQDTNTAQNQIIWSLCEENDSPNILAVGDDDQSIYRFQGASIANINDFRERFAKRKEITLTKNYRSYQDILDAAYGVVEKNNERANKDKKLVAQKKNPPNKRVHIAELIAPYSEISFIVQEIRKKRESGIPYKEMAILVRKNQEILDLAREIPKFDIPIHAKISQNIFENEGVQWMIQCLSILENPKDSEQLLTLLHAPFWNIHTHDLLRLSLDKGRHQSLIEYIFEASKKQVAETEESDPELHSLFNQAPQEAFVKTNLSESITTWLDFFATLKQSYYHMRPGALAEKILHESNFGSWLTTHKRNEDWQCIRKYIAWIREQEQTSKPSLSDILDKTTLHQDLGIALRPDPLPKDTESVQIMTAHGSKGLEFEVVFIPGLHDKKWGNPRAKAGLHLPPIIQQDQQEFDENEEERRLFFVALTRAKSEAYCCYANTDLSGREKAPSQFLSEMPEGLPDRIETDKVEESLSELLPIFFTQQESTLTKEESALIKERAKNFVWSASSLQNYLDCPRRFLYQNLYKFPRKSLPIMAQGVALHEALEKYLRKPSSEQNEKALLSEYTRALDGQNVPLSKKDQIHFDGEKILKNYFANVLQKEDKLYPNGIEIEYNFGKHSPQIDSIRITGKMDKVIYLDEKQTKVKIVDYKSGKPKPIKPGERLWRQLVFYDLLAKAALGTKWQVESCELEFLSPDLNGKLQTKNYVVSEEERMTVLQELKTAHLAIQNLEFPVTENLENDSEIEYWNTFGQHTS